MVERKGGMISVRRGRVDFFVLGGWRKDDGAMQRADACPGHMSPCGVQDDCQNEEQHPLLSAKSHGGCRGKA